MGGCDDAPLHHAQVLGPPRARRQLGGKRAIAEPGLREQLEQGLRRVQALGVELVCYDAFLNVGYHLSRYQPIAVQRQGSFPADEELIPHPLP